MGQVYPAQDIDNPRQSLKQTYIDMAFSREILELLPDSKADLSTKEEFLLRRRLRQCWRTGDFSVAKQIVSTGRFFQIYDDFYFSAAYNYKTCVCDVTWCSQVSGLVTNSIKLDLEGLHEISTVCAVSKTCVALFFVGQTYDEDEDSYDQGLRALVCLDLSSDKVTEHAAKLSFRVFLLLHN